MDRVERWLRQVEAGARRPVAERVGELLEHVRRGAQRYEGETWDQANERHAEEFITRLREQFPERVFEVARPPAHEYHEKAIRRVFGTEQPVGVPVVLVERQKLRPMARRTTSFNYIFTVPGRSLERLILVAHYDTWRGPGADDNTTGEVITLQYLMDDLRAAEPPPLTHTYILAGSEECGLIGFTSQVLLAAGFGLANIALARGVLAVTALGLAMIPLANFRFGVSGSREYVRSLSLDEMSRIRSVISVDSVGEGRMYIPESSLGADFIRAFLPFEGYRSLNHILQEAAHLNGIKYNTFIAGGTTDHISFLEVNSGLIDRIGDVLGCPRWLGCHKYGKRKIPATALVALCPGKASPMVFGGKIHTADDTAERVYPGPLAEALRILDYWFHVMHGGERVAVPREAADYHYAQLYRVERPDGRVEYWLAMKDAVEPNRRNINGLYRADVDLSGGRALCRNLRLLDWGVHTRLRHEVDDELEKSGGRHARVAVSEILVEAGGAQVRFVARGGVLTSLKIICQTALGTLERFFGTNTFLTFFAAAFGLAKLVDVLMTAVFARWFAFQMWFFEWFAITLPLTVFIQLAIILWLIGVKIPTMIDNNYRHLNRADNLASLMRVPAESAEEAGEALREVAA